MSSGRIQLGPECRIDGHLSYTLIEMAIGAEITGKLVYDPNIRE
jgi:cytoskeletal protein CcmA (bactofilin family)